MEINRTRTSNRGDLKSQLGPFESSTTCFARNCDERGELAVHLWHSGHSSHWRSTCAQLRKNSAIPTTTGLASPRRNAGRTTIRYWRTCCVTRTASRNTMSSSRLSSYYAQSIRLGAFVRRTSASPTSIRGTRLICRSRESATSRNSDSIPRPPTSNADMTFSTRSATSRWT